mgnify:CR=1 FL=1
MPTERVTEHVSRRLALHAWSATAVVAVGGLLFVLIAPGVGDMWAALARAQAARDGVTLGYWFSWYSGAHPPGGYSVIVPWLSALLGAHLVVITEGAKGVRWVSTGRLVGSMEIWLEPVPGGTLVHHYVRGTGGHPWRSPAT